MIDRGTNNILLFAGNGANRPLHQDRQVLRAGDLSLEQATQDAMLARARRYLHGWGVVAGFLPEVEDGNGVNIGPGYGVTPFGDELFLPEAVSLPNVAASVVLSCGLGPVGCSIIEPRELEAVRLAAADVRLTAWLVARPASREASPRPGVPEDCAHPGAALLPSRRCGGVEFGIICKLPPTHQSKASDCGELSRFVCGVRGTPPQPLPWEEPLGPEANFLVIAELTIAGETFTARTGARRTLWPVALIQDWIASCLCAVPIRDGDDGGLTFEPRGGGPVVTEPLTPETREPRPEGPGTGGIGELPERPPPEERVILDAIDENFARLTLPGRTPEETAIVPREIVVGLRDRLADSVTVVSGIGPARAASLAKIGVTTEGDFLTARPDLLAATLKLPEAKVTEMKKDLNTRRNLGLVFR